MARWVIFAIVVGFVWGTLATVLADGPSLDNIASDGWCSFCCGLGIGSFFIPLLGRQSARGPSKSKFQYPSGHHLNDRFVDLGHRDG